MKVEDHSFKRVFIFNYSIRSTLSDDNDIKLEIYIILKRGNNYYHWLGKWLSSI